MLTHRFMMAAHEDGEETETLGLGDLIAGEREAKLSAPLQQEN